MATCAVAIALGGGAAAPSAQALDVTLSAQPGDSYYAPSNSSLDPMAVADATDGLQQALDDVSSSGGGTVTVPVRGASSVYVIGNVLLRSNVRLVLPSAVTLLQSQRGEFYANPPRQGRFPAVRGVPWDDHMFSNWPLVYAGSGTHDVSISGGGTIRLTQHPDGEPRSFYNVAIGMFQANGVRVENVAIRDAGAFNVAVFASRDVLIEGIDVVTRDQVSTDGVSIMNSQQVRVLRSRIRNGDDGIYVWSSYRDPRGVAATGWWNTDTPQPSRAIEIGHNTVSDTSPSDDGSLYAMGVGFIPWGRGGQLPNGTRVIANDLQDVEIADVWIHDNSLQHRYAVHCWCDNPFHGQRYDLYRANFPEHEIDASPIREVQFDRNTYQGEIDLPRDTLVNFVANDFAGRSPQLFLNGGFERTGRAYWTTGGPGDAGAWRDPSVGADGQWYGYLQDVSAGETRIYQGLGLSPGVSYAFRARVQTNDPSSRFRLFARDGCNHDLLAEQSFAGGWQTQTLQFQVPSSSCPLVWVGMESGSNAHPSAWARIDAAGLVASAQARPCVEGITPCVNDHNPEVIFGGPQWWEPYSTPGDFNGRHMTASAAGNSVDVPYVGSQAELIGVRADNLGFAEIRVLDANGAVVAGPTTVDYYAQSTAAQEVIYQTPVLPWGGYTMRVTALGSRQGQSSGDYIDVDAVRVGG